MSIGGDINGLYNYLTTNVTVVDKLFSNSILSQLFVIVYDKNLSAQQMIKDLGVNKYDINLKDDLDKEKLRLENMEKKLLAKQKKFEDCYIDSIKKRFDLIYPKNMRKFFDDNLLDNLDEENNNIIYEEDSQNFGNKSQNNPNKTRAQVNNYKQTLIEKKKKKNQKDLSFNPEDLKINRLRIRKKKDLIKLRKIKKIKPRVLRRVFIRNKKIRRTRKNKILITKIRSKIKKNVYIMNSALRSRSAGKKHKRIK